MVSFDNFIIDGSGPIYAQMISFIKHGVAAGTVRDGDEMPSRRVMSALLGVNPNTVQKAYALLEEEGIVRSRSGARSFVSLDGAAVERIRAELLQSCARNAAAEMRQLGLSRDEALALLERYWEREAEV